MDTLETQTARLAIELAIETGVPHQVAIRVTHQKTGHNKRIALPIESAIAGKRGHVVKIDRAAIHGIQGQLRFRLAWWLAASEQACRHQCTDEREDHVFHAAPVDFFAQAGKPCSTRRLIETDHRTMRVIGPIRLCKTVAHQS